MRACVPGLTSFTLRNHRYDALSGLMPNDDFVWTSGGGEMGGMVRSLDWSRTALGTLQTWPQSLRTTISTCLSSRFPILILWGPELVMIYNDALARIIGNKHPRAMGQPAAEGWVEVWHVLGPMVTSVFHGGPSTWSENQRLDIERTAKSGYLEETYFTFSYSPIRDESGGIGGVFCTVTETTAQVLSERRLRTLSTLAQQTAEVTTVREACLKAAGALVDNAADVPVALVYLMQADGTLSRIAMTGVTTVGTESTDTRHDPKCFEAVLETGMPVVVEASDVQRILETLRCQTTLPVASALLLPLGPLGKPHPAGILAVGLAPLLLLDDRYHSFLLLVAGHIGIAIASATALEAAEHRADALAELDRAKTAFFSNVSHEFRTPLTLMLGPTENALASPEKSLGGDELETVQRNGLRLLRLVNTLLDFSRIEAGRADANFEPSDLPALTCDFAAAFRSTIERAGLVFEVECEIFDEPVHVDRDMWEKIVLNLVSNALKFTFEGAIRVDLRSRSGQAMLTVSDSGVGISAKELPRVFERFHRIEGVRSRSHEGTGIGLAFVHDLVKLHGGTVSVESAEGMGTSFTVSIPTGYTHLPKERIGIASTPQADRVHDSSFVMEAVRWLPAAPASNRINDAAGAHEKFGVKLPGSRILLVDDNADMREYVGRLLCQHWHVDVASDGVEALALARHAVPSLVLTDVMMPRLDGFGLLRALRADLQTRSVPVLMLSARAGENSRLEGLAMGADDYLIKPFSARELIARVTTHLELGQLRRAAETSRNHLYALFAQAPAAIAVLRGSTFIFELANAHYEEMVQRRDVVGQTLMEVFPEVEYQPIHDVLQRVFTTGQRFVGRDFLIHLQRGASAELEDVYFDFVYDPFRLADNSVDGIMVIAFEVTERVRSAQVQDRLLAEREIIYAERAELLNREREARADAERALRAKDQFLAMLGHELRNPLAPILTAFQLLRERQTDNAAAQEHAIIERQFKHLTALVNDLLDVSAIAREKIVLKREFVELSVLLDHAIEIATPAVVLRRHGLTVSVARHGLLVDADATRIAQVISNLLINASKYTTPGGHIVVSGRAHQGNVELSIADNGIGIDPEMLPHVFDLFVQEHQALDRASGGLGLGLAIVRDFVTMHGGVVSAVSGGQGAGSTFTISLPRVTGTMPSTVLIEAPPVAVEKTNSLKILIVDDNVDAANTLARYLTHLGFKVRVAYDSPSAMALVESNQPEVALLDIGLPGMDGYELAGCLRRQYGVDRLHLIAITGYGQKSDIEKSLSAGFDDHLTKPVDFAKLQALLSRQRHVPISGLP